MERVIAEESPHQHLKNEVNKYYAEAYVLKQKLRQAEEEVERLKHENIGLKQVIKELKEKTKRRL